MNFIYPDKSITVRILKEEENPSKIKSLFQSDKNNFLLDVRGVAFYEVQNGRMITIIPYKNADHQSIQLFLNGSILGAVLHQRSILPLHGNSFEYLNKGIIVCGHSGVGKSSVCMAFCQNGAQFINDDISPIIVNDKVFIQPIGTNIKLWQNSFRELKITNDKFEKIRPNINKFYFPISNKASNEQKIDHIFILGIHNKDKFEANRLNGINKYKALKNHIYRRLYLKGMPETEKKYFNQILQLSSTIKITQIIRPQICNIYDTMDFIVKEINR